MKVVVAGGGTGGHTLPVLAVIKNLQKINSEINISFIGSREGIESTLIPKMGIKYFGISCGKFRRYHTSMILNIIDPTTLVNNARDLFRFVKGIGEARSILAHEKPDVVFAKGGFVSLPVGYAAKTLGIPVVVHESDVVMGLANRKMSGFAEKICVSFPKKNYPQIDSEKIIETGNPIRDDIVMGNREKLREQLGFDKKTKTILVYGGSQGSLFINETVLEILKEILSDYQLVWVVGERDLAFIEKEMQNLDEQYKKRIKIYGFVTSEVADIYALSDLIVSRTGSNTLFEIAALGKPAILIPHAESPGGHQYENARVFSRSGAASLMKQSTVTPKKLLHQIKYLLESPEELNSMSEKMKHWANPEAAYNVAKIVYEVGVKHIEQSTKLKEENQ